MVSRVIFAHGEPTAGHTRVSVVFQSAGHGYPLSVLGRELDDKVVQRSHLLQSLLSTSGETCVPVLPRHFNLWATYDPTNDRDSDTKALFDVLEVR